MTGKVGGSGRLWILLLLVLVLPSVAQERPTDARSVTIYIYRPRELGGTGQYPSIYCDATELARIGRGRFFIAKIPAGKHTFRANDPKIAIELSLNPGEVHYIRIDPSGGGPFKAEMRLSHIMPDQATPELKQVKYITEDRIKNYTLVLPRPQSADAIQ